jgi:geranylgeranyl diphosphate synthase type II
MDDELERRNKPVLHHVYEESVAILVSYSLISAGYELLAKNASTLCQKKVIDKNRSNELCFIALQEVSKVAGISGVTNGQFLDLFPPDSSLETILKIIEQKTVALFEISFVLGWVFGGGDLNKLEEIKETSYHFGKAFQIADDLNDIEQDLENQNQINIAIVLGKEKALDLFYEEVNLFKEKIKDLGLLTPSFKKICDLLENSIK